MSDLIDRQKLLRDIEKYHVSDGKFQHWVQIQPQIQPEVLACGEGILEAKDERWIPVSERLPEIVGHYLTTTEFGEVYCDFWNNYEFRRTETENVIAWMPLPEPYKEVEG